MAWEHTQWFAGGLGPSAAAGSPWSGSDGTTPPSTRRSAPLNAEQHHTDWGHGRTKRKLTKQSIWSNPVPIRVQRVSGMASTQYIHASSYETGNPCMFKKKNEMRLKGSAVPRKPAGILLRWCLWSVAITTEPALLLAPGIERILWLRARRLHHSPPPCSPEHKPTEYTWTCGVTAARRSHPPS